MPVTGDQIDKWVKECCLSKTARRSTAEKWLDYLEGRQLKHVPKNPDEKQSHFDKRPKLTFNLTRRIVDFKACLYDDGATRECSDPVVRDFWANADLDTVLREADPVIDLCGAYFVQPDYVREDRGIWRRLVAWLMRRPAGVWRVDCYAANQVEVLPDPELPEVPLALAIISTGRDAAGLEVPRVQVWTAEDYRVYLGPGLQGTVQPHSFGRIPVAPLRGRVSHLVDFWGVGSGENIVPQNEEINRLISSSEWLAICQSHGVIEAMNAPADWRPKLGPDMIVRTYSDPNVPAASFGLKIHAPSSDIDKLRAHIDWLVDALQASNDVPAGTFQLGQNREAGSAIEAKLREAKRYRKRRKPQARSWEQHLADLARVVYAVRMGNPAPTDQIKISVNWKEPEPAASTSETVQMEQHELQAGLVTGPQLLQRRDPDLPDAQAVIDFKANVEFNRANAAAGVEAALPGAGQGAPSAEARAAAEAALAAAGSGATK